MHELYIAESIIRSVKGALPETVAPEQVTAVHLDVGALDAVIPDTLSFLFDAIKAEQGLSRATLVTTTIVVECHCRQCGEQFPVEFPLFLCPVCHSGDVKVVKGRGINITRIIADV